MVNKVQVKLSWVFEREDLFCPRAEENALKSNWILDYITYMTLYTYLYYLKEYFEMYIQSSHTKCLFFWTIAFWENVTTSVFTYFYDDEDHDEWLHLNKKPCKLTCHLQNEIKHTSTKLRRQLKAVTQEFLLTKG